MSDKIYCPVEGCTRMIRRGSKTGVCRDHVHRRPHCRCAQCRGEGRRYRVRTREEIRALYDDAMKKRS
jgi:hypothetical protein